MSGLDTITFELLPSEDTEIRCVTCVDTRPCEFALVVLGDGRTTWWGMHLRCVEAQRRRFAKRHVDVTLTVARLTKERDEARAQRDSLVKLESILRLLGGGP